MHAFLTNPVLRDILLVLQTLISLALIAIVSSQTSKNEGLTGNIGGPTTSNFKGKPGWEETLATTTRNLGIVWFAMCFLVGIVFAQ